MFPYLPKGLHWVAKWKQKFIVRGGLSCKLRVGDVTAAKSVRDGMT
jgi:hypothetical protein